MAAALGRHVAELLRQLHRAAERLVAGVQVDLLRRRGEGLARRRAHEVLAELHARGELALAVPSLHGQVPHLARELRRAIVFLGRPHRRRPTQPHVDPQARVAERLGQRGQLGEPLHPVPGPPQHVERPVARVQQPHALLRGRGGRQRQLDDAQDLLGRVGGERVPAGLDREPHAHGPVARRLRVTGDQRQARGRGLARHQEPDDRRVDRPPRGRRERRGGELADLLVLEAVVGGRALLVLGQQSRRDGRRQGFGELLGVGRRPVHAELDLAQVLQAEPPSQDRRDGQQRLRRIGQLRRPPRDQRLHRRGHQPLGVAGQGPDAVDLLDHPALAVGERHLLDDERDALGLRVHHGRARRVDRTAEHLGQELARLGLGEPVDLEAADDPHATHVGDQVHGFGDDRELLGADREHQEDRARAVGADHVAQQAEAVLVRPLQVVDQDGERPFGGQGSERDGAQVERAEQPAVGRERGEPRVVLTRHRVQAAGERLGGLRAGRVRAASGEPRIERATRNGPRSSSSAVTAIAVKPSAVARSAAATSSRVLPIPGSPSTVRPTSRPVRAMANSCEIDWSSAGRPTTSPVARWTSRAIGEKDSGRSSSVITWSPEGRDVRVAHSGLGSRPVETRS